MILRQKLKRGLRTFFAWGGLTTVATYLLDGDFTKAITISAVISLAIAADQYYSAPD